MSTALTAAGCSKGVDSPPIAAGSPPSAVSPDLVCVDQLTTKVTLKGTGFTPMPSNVLELPTRLLLPSVVLNRFTALDGTSAAGTFKIFDDPAVPASSRLHWISAEEMAFDVAPDLKLSAGIYDLVVTNPDGKATATFAKSLAAVLPPLIKTPPAICDAQSDQRVTIEGANFLHAGAGLPAVMIGSQTFTATAVAGCTAVAGTLAEGVVETCSSLTVSIPKGTFAAGDYPVIVTNPAPAACQSSEAVSLHVEPPPIVTTVVPGAVCTGGTKLKITGSGFFSPPAVTLEGTGLATVKSTSATASADGTQVTAQIGVGALLGSTYDVVVTNPDTCTDSPPHKTVTVVAGPILYQADPEVVYSGINMRVTLFATGLTGSVAADGIAMTPHGAAAPVTTLPWTPVVGHPNRFQVIIPKAQAAGSYDIVLSDATGCSAVLPNGITVTAALTVAIKNVVPPFGWTGGETAVTIFRDATAAAPANKPFVATPRAFINPVNAGPTDVALPLQSVAWVDASTLTAVVPAGEPVGSYDLLVANPDGTVGYVANAFKVTQAKPPTISTVTPSSMVNAANQSLVIAGKNFRGSSVSLTCVDAAGNPLAAPATVSGILTCDANQVCAQPVTVNASALSAGAVCLTRITNNDGTFVDYSAVGVTNSSLNLATPKAGTAMTVGRRALVASAGDATDAARFVYAIGGDTGAAAAATPLSSTEYAAVDLFGTMKPWVAQRYTLGGGRSFAGSAKVGRYTYLYGGTDGANNLATAQRAMILNPREVPGLDISDIVPAAAGLEPGYWFYKVAAVFAANDLDNPKGESLPSDEFIVKVPAFPGKKIQVALVWSAPLDALGAPLPNVTGYRVYRSATVNSTSGSEVLLASTNAATFAFNDDAASVAGVEKPLPIGSMGQWAALPSMLFSRKGPAGAVGFDPGNVSKFYVYSLLGLGAGNTGLSSYEYLPVTIQANGHQVVGNVWTIGVSQSAQARWQLGAWAADVSVSSLISSADTYIYLGGGLTAANSNATKVEVGKVAVGGDLGTLSDAPKDFGASSAGYGVCAANGQLFSFGGFNAAPASGAKSASLINPAPTLANNSWNDEGLAMTQPRYLMGSAVQSAFIFLVGGQTTASAASTTTELVVW